MIQPFTVIQTFVPFTFIPILFCSSLMGELYTQHKDEDGFIYVMYSGENTFGDTSENNAVELSTTEG